MYNPTLLFLVLVSLLVACSAQSFSTSLLAGKLQLEWTLGDKTVTFTATSATTGWVGVGFSPSGGMVGTNAVIGLVGPDGFGVVNQYNVTAKIVAGVVKFAANPNIQLQEPTFFQVGGSSIMKFTWDTSVPSSYNWTPQSSVNMVFALGTSNTLAYHGKEGKVQAIVSLSTGKVTVQ
eukprot:TRINITY_DN10632_c0_g1_i1.p1 TRINITY_DN10632_c0_g1~~TRINITY_DN10632_c0_g1_i1.p1  ORF type:complete len:177 (+),score=37.71 TRINITY_DN10632_c0_g1_i1:43-573(+)